MSEPVRSMELRQELAALFASDDELYEPHRLMQRLWQLYNEYGSTLYGEVAVPILQNHRQVIAEPRIVHYARDVLSLEEAVGLWPGLTFDLVLSDRTSRESLSVILSHDALSSMTGLTVHREGCADMIISALLDGEFAGHLEILDLYRRDFRASDLELLASCPLTSLRALSLGDELLSGARVEKLLRARWFSQLECLGLSNTSLDARSVDVLLDHAPFHKIKALDISSNEALDVGELSRLFGSGAFPALEQLELDESMLTELPGFLTSVEVLPRLERLNLSHNPLPITAFDADIPGIARLTGLYMTGLSWDVPSFTDWFDYPAIAQIDAILARASATPAPPLPDGRVELAGWYSSSGGHIPTSIARTFSHDVFRRIVCQSVF